MLCEYVVEMFQQRSRGRQTLTPTGPYEFWTFSPVPLLQQPVVGDYSFFAVPVEHLLKLFHVVEQSNISIMKLEWKARSKAS